MASQQFATVGHGNLLLKSLIEARPGSIIPGIREIRDRGTDFASDTKHLEVVADDNRKYLVRVPMSGELLTKESVRALIREQLSGLYNPMPPAHTYGTSTVAYQAQQNAAYQQQAQWAGGGGGGGVSYGSGGAGGSGYVSQLEAYGRAMLQHQQIDEAIKARLALKKEPEPSPAESQTQETEMSIEQNGNNIVPDVNLTHVFKWAVVLVIALFLGRRVWDQFGEKITQNLHKALDHSTGS